MRKENRNERKKGKERKLAKRDYFLHVIRRMIRKIEVSRCPRANIRIEVKSEADQSAQQ